MHRLRSWIWLALLAGCHLHSNHVDGGVLGRVVVYRNGVAFYERNATVEDGHLTVHVPRDKVDDFLKSLTVVDRISRKPLSVMIPRQTQGDAGYLTMDVQTPEHSHADVLLTYVTEAPAWKPSYRVVVNDEHPDRVMLEGWAVVDNTTSEDWKGVLVGVGASSALAFRYDLWSVHTVDRDLLQGEQRFAIAPPTGLSPYSETGAEEVAALDSTEVRGATAGAAGSPYGASISGATSSESNFTVDGLNTTSTTFDSSGKAVTAGAIRGTAKDPAMHEPAIGATVVASSPALHGEQVAITDEHGNFAIGALPPGTYTLTTYYNNSTFTRANLVVNAGREVVANMNLNSSSAGGTAKGEVIEISGNLPIIDQGSTKTGITITSEYIKNVPLPGRTFSGTLGAAAGSQADGNGHPISSAEYLKSRPASPRNGSAAEVTSTALAQGDAKLKAAVSKVLSAKKDVLIETHAATDNEAKARAETVRNKLVDEGVPATKIHVSAKADGEAPVRVLAVAPGATPTTAAPPSAAARGAMPDTPVGESNFEAERPMTVRAGSSAMVSMVRNETNGGVVYLYDPISDRGDQRFAFKAVRLDNPTTNTLEPGPVTVYGKGRFIGEGITEPVPPKASVVVPFALDRQIVVTREGAETDRIAKLETMQRGVLTAEVQHRRETTFTITSRLHEPTRVYLRHPIQQGWEVTEAPRNSMKVGDSRMYEVVLAAGATEHVKIVESTPLEKTIDLASEDAIRMMRVFVDEPNATPELKAQLIAMLATHQGAHDLLDKIQTLRDEIAEYRSRSNELNAQIVTLKAVRTGGDLLVSLKAKLADCSERIQKATIAIVETQEKMMLARVKFQTQLSELHLTDATAKAARK